MKRVRLLLRVSSEQQLEADGDLSIQRKILTEYVSGHTEWLLDSKKEYFEGGVSGYKNKASDRTVLQEILADAEQHEFDILVVYKDDRVGRLMWDTPVFIMNLKALKVDVYSVKDGCISPAADDIMGQMMLTFRYANAQKSSSDTGMRVKDNAVKLIENGKFMGGKAPYGYELTYSGAISKHGRALKQLVIVPERAEVVRHIYHLSLNKEYGSMKIAKALNADSRYNHLAPKDQWKSGTITGILSNPIYAGYLSYKRRERINGAIHRLDSREWILSRERNEGLVIIDENVWNRVQEKRALRRQKVAKSLTDKDIIIVMNNNAQLPLLDVAYCGYCGHKLTRGTKYNYWKLKSTGEKRTSVYPVYKCSSANQGILHEKYNQFRADRIEQVIFSVIAEHIGLIQKNENISDIIIRNQKNERKAIHHEITKMQQALAHIEEKIRVIDENIPDAMLGNYPVKLEDLINMKNRQLEVREEQLRLIEARKASLQTANIMENEWLEHEKFPKTWQEVFLNADTATKRVLVNRLVERIDVRKDEIRIRFRIAGCLREK